MNTKCILFADDDVMTQWTMTEVLTEAGYAVVGACRGCEAVALLGDEADFDLLIIDLDLPDNVSGSNAAESWRRALPGRPVIFTGSATSAVRALDQHETFVEKPFSASSLLEAIETALEDAAFLPFLRVVSRRSHYLH